MFKKRCIHCYLLVLIRRNQCDVIEFRIGKHKKLCWKNAISAMAPAYKLTYFNVKGLSEPIRYLLSYGNIEFEDVRVEKENWPNIKPNMPFGQAPVLEVNGKIAHQSLAIARYVAKQVKLVGKDDWENLEIDAVVDTINDLKQKIILYCYETDEKIKETRKDQLFNETLPYYLSRLDAIAKANNGHLAVGRLTWADFYFAGISECLNAVLKTNMIAEYPNLQAVKKNVESLPAVKKWIAKRPQTDM